MKAEISEFSCWLDETNPTRLKEIFQEILEAVGFSIIGFTDHHFSPQGYTGMWIIAESHLALHTFPEENRTYLQLSSCNEPKLDEFIKKIKYKFVDTEAK